MTARWPFVAAAAIAAVPLFVLGYAAPGGNDWVMLEYPRHITFFAIALGIAVCFARKRPTALIVLAGTASIALAWEMIGEYRGLVRHGRTDLFSSEIDLLVKLSVGRAAPWLMGGVYAVLAYLAIARAKHDRHNRIRAGVWLVAVGAIAAIITTSNESWETFASSDQHVIRSSVAWPDTKKASLVLDLIAIGIGLAAIFMHPRKPDPIPRATVRARDER